MPIIARGMPGLNVTSVQVSPPSVVFQSPLRPEPASIPHGLRWNFHVLAKRMRGFVGSRLRSATPVLSFTYSTFFHDLPPSVVRKTPRSLLGPKACPSDETHARSGSLVSTRIAVMW